VTALPAAPAKVQRKSAEVRERILDAALAAFSLDGFHGATMQAIASAAGANLSLMIYHFGSKIDLWKAAVDRMAQRVSARFAEVDLTALPTAEARLRHMISFQIQLAAEMPEYHRIITMEGFQSSDRLEWLVNRHRPEFDLLRSVIAAAERDGVIADVDVERLRYMIISAVTLPSISAEYRLSTGRDAFDPKELEQTERFLFRLLFGEAPRA